LKFNSKPTVVDIFCGAGGLSEGFRQAGFEIILGIDNDPFALKTFKRHHGNVIECSVEDITARRIRRELEGRPVNLLVGGPPCQAFSHVVMGKLRSLKKSTTRRHPLNRLYKDFLRLVKELQPEFFLMENVGRMFSMANGAIKKEIEFDLRKKYSVRFYYENVKDYGVPQSRKRGLVIGNRLGIPNSTLTPTHYDPIKKPADGRKPYENLRTAISDLPRIKAGTGEERQEYPENKNLSTYQRERRKGSRAVYNHTARMHSERDLKIFKLLRPKQWMDHLPKKYNPYRTDIFLDKFKKQDWASPSSTILAHLSKDGLMFIHPDRRQNRSLTPREAARLQSFDDTYIFDGPRTQQFIQIGNAVPPLFAKCVGNKIIESLKIKYSPKIKNTIKLKKIK